MTIHTDPRPMRTESRNPARTARHAGRLLAALALVAAACSQQPAPPPATATSPSPGLPAHGEPPSKAAGLAQCTGTDPHQQHLSRFDCNVCHSTAGGAYAFDVPYAFPGGTTTAGGTVVKGTATTPTTCTVACHYPKGQPAKAVTWNTPGPLACVDCHATTALPAAHPAMAANATRADCAGCHVTTGHLSGAVTLAPHVTGWSDRTSPAFHAFPANQGLGACQGCHGPTLDGTVAASSCGRCHDTALPAGVTSWKVNCVMCHGGTDNASGAPPKATWGNSADLVRIGAHTAHVAASARAPAFDCSTCHVKPADALANGHLDASPTAQVTWGGVAVANGATPAWNRTAATCSNTYCHGSFPNGNATNAPVWTSVGTGQGACGTCHGLPPGGSHPSASSSLSGCAVCHPATMDATGVLIPPSAGGKHLDGIIQVSGGGHASTWMDTASPGFHAYSANAGIASCQSCHGVNLDGVGGSATTSCASCHGATWRTSCTMCHGGVNDQTGAPPKGTWGYRADAARIGAHTKHLSAGAIAGATPCATCHVVPTDATSAGHLDGPSATVTFGGIAGASNATPSWNRSTGSCASTYCHGGYSGTFSYYFWGDVSAPYSGSNASPRWTDGPMTCTSCHANPPLNGNWHSGFHGGGNGCNLCHPHVNSTGTAILNPALHVNGVVDVNPSYKSSCFNCH